MVKRTDHAERREAFAQAALRVIMRAGVGGLTIREVAKEAGFTTGALAHYFRSKDQVLLEASLQSGKVTRARMEREARHQDALAALKGVVEEALPMKPNVRGMWRVWFGFWERSAYNPAVAKEMRARYAEWRGRIVDLIQRAQDEGLASTAVDAELAARELVAIVDGISIQVLLDVGQFPPARQRAMIDNWIRLMAAGEIGRPAADAPQS